MIFCPTILICMVYIYFRRIACVGKLCFAILVESHRISYHVLCSPFIKMRIFYECLADCLADVGHGFSKNKVFYENLHAPILGLYGENIFKIKTYKNVFLWAEWYVWSVYKSCMQLMALQSQDFCGHHRPGSKRSSKFQLRKLPVQPHAIWALA